MSDKRSFLDRLLQELNRMINDDSFIGEKTAVQTLEAVREWALDQTVPPIIQAAEMGTKAEQLEKVTVTLDVMRVTEHSLHDNARDLGLTDGEVLDHMLLKYNCKDPKLAAMRILQEMLFVTFEQDANSFLSTITFVASPLFDMLRNPQRFTALFNMRNCSENLSDLGELVEQAADQVFLKEIMIENPDKIVLDLTDSKIIFSAAGQEQLDNCPDLEKRAERVLELLGYGRHTASRLMDVIDAFTDEEITIDELKQRLIKLSGK